MTVTELHNPATDTDAPETTTREVTFDADRLPRLIEELARLNKIAAKLGADPITHEVTGTGTRKATRGGYHANLYGDGADRHYDVDTVTVTLTGATPRLPGGWKFLGSIEFLPEDARLVHGDDPRVGTYRNGDNGCDHCRYNRNRGKVVVLINDDDELVKVGSTCIKDFLGYHGDPEKVTWFAEDITDTLSDLDEDGGRFARTPDSVPTDVFVALAAATVRTFGWMAKSAWDGIPTANRVGDILFPPIRDRHNGDYLDELATVKITEADEAKATEIRSWAAELDLSNNYLGNVRTILGASYITGRHFGIAASAVGAYDREMGLAAERVAKEAGIVSEWVGTVGKRETFTVEVTRIHVYETAFGTSRIVVTKDGAGNVVKTFTSGRWAYGTDVGDELVIKGTVKEHGEYKGTKETVLARVAVVK